MAETSTPPPRTDAALTLWYRPRRGQRWQPVAWADAERELVKQIGTGGRRGGDWVILPKGMEP